MDLSHLDAKYFIDQAVYNCPYCKRRNVTYVINGVESFDWSNNKKCYVYFVIGSCCKKRSMHLSFQNLPTETFIRHTDRRFDVAGEDGLDLDEVELDDFFFFSVPTSLFAIDSRIPRQLRELLTEAEGCMKSNFLTGASACVRKVIYELAAREGADGDNYEDQLRSLKDEFPEVDDTYFDTLLTIQQVTSTKVHENAHDGWESRHLRIMIETLQKALQEIYVYPKVKEESRKQILELKQQLMPDEESASPATEQDDSSADRT